MVDADGRIKFSELVRDIASGKSEEHPLPGSIGKFETPLPEGGTVYDYFFQCNGRGKWANWTELIRGQDVPCDKTISVSNIIVPTVDTARCKYLTDLCIKHRRPVLFVGATGTGEYTFIYTYKICML